MITATFRLLDYRWLVVALSSFFLFWFFDAVLLWYFRMQFQAKATLSSCLKASISGLAFGFLTPLQTGNVAAQMVVLSKDNMETGSAVALLLMKNIVLMFAMILIMLGAVIVNGSVLLLIDTKLFWIVISGVLLNLLFALILIWAGLAKKTVLRFVHWCIRWLKRIHIVRNEERVLKKAVAEIDRMNANFITLRGRLPVLFIGMTIGIASILSSYHITYFIYRSFNLVGNSVIDIVTRQIFCGIIQTVVPIPGGIGIVDSGYYFILKSIFTERYINYGILLWRITTFYLPIMLGLIITFGHSKRKA